MNCKKCGISVDDRPLQRVNETGIKGIYWYEPCIKEHEPELYRNIMEDKTDAEIALEEICYPQREIRDVRDFDVLGETVEP
jgi:L-alanine-DL-glutamate epimerase-like enolase superfamily enzyme